MYAERIKNETKQIRDALEIHTGSQGEHQLKQHTT